MASSTQWLRCTYMPLAAQITGALAFLLIKFGIIIDAGLPFMPLRILIADDSRTVRHSLHGLLEQHPDWVVCAEAVDGADAITKAQQCRPDIVILDFFMPGMTGIEAGQVLGRILPSLPVLIVTLYITAQLVKQAKGVGIKGVVPKSDSRQIVDGVKALIHHGTFFESQPIEPVAQSLL